MLELDPSVSDEEIRRAYRRQREVYAGESMAIAGLYSPEGLATVQGVSAGAVCDGGVVWASFTLVLFSP